MFYCKSCWQIVSRLVFISLILVTSAAAADTPSQPHLTIRGSATLAVPPDQVSLTLGVVTENAQAKTALALNSRQLKAAIQRLEAMGFTRKDYKTLNFSINPLWSRKSSLNGNNENRISGYRASNQLRLTTDKLEQLGDIIAKVAEAGANQIQSIQFGLKNPRQYRDQAIKQASENARADANSLAVANGLTLVRVLSVNLNDSVASRSRAAPELAYSLAADATPPISAGDININASVTLVFEIKE